MANLRIENAHLKLDEETVDANMFGILTRSPLVPNVVVKSRFLPFLTKVLKCLIVVDIQIHCIGNG